MYVHALYIGCGRIEDEKGNNTMLCMYVISYACESIKDADVKKENRIRELVEEKHELKQRCVCSLIHDVCGVIQDMTLCRMILRVATQSTWSSVATTRRR